MEMAVWKARLERLGKRVDRVIGDLNRGLDWHIGGGQRFFERYYDEIVGAHKWCFIVGCNNSGTSLLHSLLKRSGSVATMTFEGQRYTNAVARSEKRGHERVWSEYLHELRMTAVDPRDSAARMVHDWMRELPLPIQTIVVEKTPANAVRMTWLQEVFPQSCFIGVVRNGYAVTEGILRKGKKPVVRGARHWNLVNKIMVSDAQHVRNYMEIRYEDLVDDFANSMERVAEFIGIDPDNLCGGKEEGYTASTVAGKGKHAIQNFNNESIRRLTPDEIRIISDEAGEMLDYFGYGIPDARSEVQSRQAVVR